MSTVNLSSSASTPDSATTSSLPERHGHKSFSCVLCAQRKVRCDKAPGGCTNCTRARVVCVYKAPPPPRRRKKGVREIDLQGRLRLYERALRERGVDPEELVRREVEGKDGGGEKEDLLGMNKFGDEGGVVRGRREEGGRNGGVLVAEGGKSRYLENTLWTSLQSEFRDPKRILEDSEEEGEEEDAERMERLTSGVDVHGVDALLGGSLLGSTTGAPSNLRAWHPSPGQIFKLWQVYLDNINPLIKVFHAPSVQQVISNASSNLDDVPKNVECLMFGIYCTAVESLGNTECIAIMGESKQIVSKRFKTAGHLALIRSSFLKTSDPMVLQAFVLFITSLINFDARVIWILTGVASRIGQRIGLHQDPANLGLPPFECEMRRRLWYQIMMADGFAEKLAGTGGTTLFGHVRRPLNLNDSDLSPDMKDLPKEHSGATEMMFFLIRCHLGDFLRHSTTPGATFDGVWNKLSSGASPLSTKDKAIDELEALYHRKFLQHCDTSIPWHFMCTFLAKGIISMLRFIAHSPTSPSTPPPPSEQNLLFTWAVDVVRWQNKAYTTPEMHGCLWHINSHFQWKGFVYIVSALRERTRGEEVDQAWREVQTVFEFHPNFKTKLRRQALPVAVARLTLEAWEMYVRDRGVPEGGEPFFIRLLRGREEREGVGKGMGVREGRVVEERDGSGAVQDGVEFGQQQGPVGDVPYEDPVDSFQWGADALDAIGDPLLGGFDMPMEEGQMNWSNWDNVMLNFELQRANNTAVDGAGFASTYGAYGQTNSSF